MNHLIQVQELNDEALGQILRELAEQAFEARFDVAPNPCVGAAVLSRGQIVGRGIHHYWGGPHAEVEALRQAAASSTPKSEWDTMVVTLEPCSSTDKTPPCIDAVLESGVKHVVLGSLDPDPRHRGRAVGMLEAAGVEVTVLEPCLGPRCPWGLPDIAQHFLDWNQIERLRRPRPWNIAKWAQTRTGQLTPPENIGEGRWISGPESLLEVQELRGRVDAILTGIGTVRADDPRLSVRAPGEVSNPPMRVVFDSYLHMSPDARMFEPVDPSALAAGQEAAGPVVIFTRPGPDPVRTRRLLAKGAEIVALPPDDDGQLSLWAASEWLWKRGVRRSLLEAGPTMIQSFMDHSLVDQIRVYSGDVSGGRGTSLGSLLADGRPKARLHRESGPDAVLEYFR
ncbi:MAG: diaminohydroxyphosphoribosylaminopyrimidine deaminase [Bacteroidia bacterium]|jgi:diaminohydroxyphosphoribosylaminopyrimidine deaminase/5-amino-6-(5-phosphoribosylamino)uracil reductase